MYGIFADENKCDVFWNCWNGEASRYQCSPGLAYDREARVCMWADQVPECRVEGNYLSFPPTHHHTKPITIFVCVHSLNSIFRCCSILQKLPTVSLVQPPVKCRTPVHSRVTLTQKIAANTTSAWMVLPVNTVAQSEPSSRSVTAMALATAKTQKMFPDGE